MTVDISVREGVVSYVLIHIEFPIKYSSLYFETILMDSFGTMIW